MDREFYMTLLSNIRTDSGNTIALFDRQLPQCYELDDSWDIGVAELSYTKSWINVRNNVSVRI